MATTPPSSVERIKKEVSALDAFLSANPQREQETVRVEIQSLGAAVTVRELTEAEINDILARYESDDERRKSGMPVNTIDQTARIVAMALVDPNVRDPKVLDRLNERFGCGANPEIAIRAVMRPLEITKLANIVMEISGMSDDAVKIAGN